MPRLHYALTILGLAFLAVFAALGLGRFGYSMVLPSMQKTLALSNTQTGTLQSWNLFGYMLAVIVTGALASHLGPRRVISAGLLLLAAAMALTGVAAGVAGLSAARCLTGVAAAAVNVPAMGLLASWFAKEKRGLATGIGVTGSSLGLIVTGPLVPAVLEHFGPDPGWRLCWWLFGALALLVAAACAIGLRNRPSDCGLTPFGSLPQAAEPTGPDHAAAASTPVLTWHDLIRDAYLWRLGVVYFAFGFSYIIYSTFFVRHLVQVAHMPPAAAGNLWLQVGIYSMASGLLWGAISDRIGRRTCVILIFVLQGVAFLLFGWSAAKPAVTASVVLFAATAWSIPALMAATAGDHFGPRLAATALGVITFLFGLGQVLGPYTAGRLADRYGSFAPAFLLAGGIALVIGAGGAALLATPKPKHI